MTATLWINEAEDVALELGGTIQLYQALDDMFQTAGPLFFSTWPDLSGIATQVEIQTDAAPEWLADVRAQARQFLAAYEASLLPHTVWVLKQLANELTDNNCGTGGGGFKPGNTCAATRGGGGGDKGKGGGSAGEPEVLPSRVLGAEFETGKYRAATEEEKAEFVDLVKQRNEVRKRLKGGGTEEDLRQEERIQKHIQEIREAAQKRTKEEGKQDKGDSKKGEQKKETKEDDAATKQRKQWEEADRLRKEQQQQERKAHDETESRIQERRRQITEEQQRKADEAKARVERNLREDQEAGQRTSESIQRMMAEDHARQKAQFEKGETPTVGQSLTRDQLKLTLGKTNFRAEEARRLLNEVIEPRATTNPTPVLQHGMSKPEAMRMVTVDGITYQWAEVAKPQALSAVVRISNNDIPSPLMKATSEVIFSSQSNRHDSFWEKEYNTKDFKSPATGGDGKVVVYNTSMSIAIFTHEAGHNLATRLWGNTTPPPTSRYGQAQAKERPVSDYAKNSASEDWAEACSRYVVDKVALQRDFPLKFAAVEHHFKEAEGLQ